LLSLPLPVGGVLIYHSLKLTTEQICAQLGGHKFKLVHQVKSLGGDGTPRNHRLLYDFDEVVNGCVHKVNQHMYRAGSLLRRECLIRGNQGIG
jgi:hypothetical protein